jgi:hypothetical protein
MNGAWHAIQYLIKIYDSETFFNMTKQSNKIIYYSHAVYLKYDTYV